MLFKIKPHLEFNNIIPRIKISISKNTESIDMTSVLVHVYTIIITKI